MLFFNPKIRSVCCPKIIQMQKRQNLSQVHSPSAKGEQKSVRVTKGEQSALSIRFITYLLSTDFFLPGNIQHVAGVYNIGGKTTREISCCLACHKCCKRIKELQISKGLLKSKPQVTKGELGFDRGRWVRSFLAE